MLIFLKGEKKRLEFVFFQALFNIFFKKILMIHIFFIVLTRKMNRLKRNERDNGAVAAAAAADDDDRHRRLTGRIFFLN